MSEGANGPAALEAELDALYGAPLAEFIARRDALAKRLKAGGDAGEARRIKALRKPSVVAWAINRLHLDSAGSAGSHQGGRGGGRGGGGLAPLEEASEALRSVLRESRSAEERRAAIEARRRALESVSTAVVALLEESGAAMAPALLRRVEGTLLALASGTGAAGASAPVPGRLDQELEPPGFEAIQDFPAPFAPAAPGKATPERTAARKSGSPAPATAPASTGASMSGRPSPTGAAPSRPSGSERAGTTSKPAAAPAQPSRTAPASGVPTTGSERPYVPTRDRKREAAIAAAQRAVDDSEAALERATTRAEAARDRADQAEKALERARREVEAARHELVAARTALSESRRELDRIRRG